MITQKEALYIKLLCDAVNWV